MQKLFNKKNPLFLLIFSALLLISTIIVPAQTADAACDEVSLYYLNSNYRTHGYYEDNIYIKVANLAYEKDVSVNYAFSSDNGIYKEATAEYVASLDSNYDIFKVNVSGFGSLSYSIKYKVNGKEYIDDNNGNNYDDSYTLGSASIYACNLHGSSVSAVVRDYNDPNAVVTMVYTTDNWNTRQTKTLNLCSYELDNNEKPYSCYLDFNVSDPGFEFAISYTANGITYWDNNFGKNYNYSNHHSVC